MREIGGDFWTVPTSSHNNGLFSESTKWFLSGRSALRAITESLENCHSVAIPSWCCESMIKPFIEAGMEIHFYPVYWNGGLVQEVDLKEDVLLLVDYFGYNTYQPSVNDYKGIIIRDVTHSLFSGEYAKADYYFGSLRKWCGVWTGGFAWSNYNEIQVADDIKDKGFIALRKKAMALKTEYMQAMENGDEHLKTHLNCYNKAEQLLEDIGIVSSTERDVQMAHQLDANTIIRRRRDNAEVLRNAFADWLLFPELKETDCPLFVPVLIPDGKRDEVRSYLIQNRIYCPVHWPISRYHEIDEATSVIYQNELSFVCDQRYTPEDMERVAKTLNQYRRRWK